MTLTINNTYPGFTSPNSTVVPTLNLNLNHSTHQPNQPGAGVEPSLSLLLVDSQPLFMRGVRRSFHSTQEQVQAEFEIIGEAATTPQAALRLAQKELPQVILGDIDILLELNSLEPFRTLRQHHPHHLAVVALTPFENDAQLLLALKVGAAAYCARQVQPARLAEVVRQVADGHFPINELALAKPYLARLVLKQFNEMTSNRAEAQVGRLPAALTPRNALSNREMDVLEQVALGLSNQAISRRLSISEHTTKNHVTNILRKLGATDRTGAVLRAVRYGLLTIPPLNSGSEMKGEPNHYTGSRAPVTLAI